MNTQIVSLSEFLLKTDAQIRFYDIGRRVSKITLSDFKKFERAEIPYPFPVEQTGWIGLIYWNKKDRSQHNIWFLRLPLDETGLIQLSARDEFMHLLLSRFSEQIHASSDFRAFEYVLKDNPYVFKPPQDKMAIFHSKARLELQQPPTKFYADTLNYLQEKKPQQWQHLGIQGIADIAVRQDQKNIYPHLYRTIPTLPDEVYCAFCQSLENESIKLDLAKVIVKRIDDSNDDQIIASGIRALACCQSKHYRNHTIHSVLERSDKNQFLFLAAIAAKAWEALFDQKILQLFLEKLSISEAGSKLFNSLMMDLIFIPGMRENILSEFRAPHRSENLTRAVGNFFKHTGQ